MSFAFAWLIVAVCVACSSAAPSDGEAERRFPNSRFATEPSFPDPEPVYDPADQIDVVSWQAGYSPQAWVEDPRARLSLADLGVNGARRPVLRVERGLLSLPNDDELVVVGVEQTLRVYATWATCFRFDLVHPPETIRRSAPASEAWMLLAELRLPEDAGAVTCVRAIDREAAGGADALSCTIVVGTATSGSATADLWAADVAPHTWMQDRSRGPRVIELAPCELPDAPAGVAALSVIEATQHVAVASRDGVVSVLSFGEAGTVALQSRIETGLWELSDLATYADDDGGNLRLVAVGHHTNRPVRRYSFSRRRWTELPIDLTGESVVAVRTLRGEPRADLLLATTGGRLILVLNDPEATPELRQIDWANAGAPAGLVEAVADPGARVILSGVETSPDGRACVIATAFGACVLVFDRGQLNRDTPAIVGSPTWVASAGKSVAACAMSAGNCPLVLVTPAFGVGATLEEPSAAGSFLSRFTHFASGHSAPQFDRNVAQE